MRTFHLSSLPKGMKGRKIKKDGKEAYRVRLNSRAARQLRRAIEAGKERIEITSIWTKNQQALGSSRE